MDSFESLLDSYATAGKLHLPSVNTLRDFYRSYITAGIENGYSAEHCKALLHTFLELLIAQATHPYTFPIHHKAIREPFDYFRYSLEFIRPLVKADKSTVQGIDHADHIEELLDRKENVIFLANHQTEPDAALINLLLEKGHPHLAQELIYVAGHRVVHDPLAVPLSMGCNLLCIWSKRHIENPPELRSSKLEHNQKTIRTMQQLLNEGGKAIYVAPSGGRDRPNAEGVLTVSPFDPSATEIFLICARHAERPTHIFTMALSTYDLMPPPDRIPIELGEPRYTSLTPVHLSIGSEINVEELIANTPGSDRRQQREWRALEIWKTVKNLYDKLE